MKAFATKQEVESIVDKKISPVHELMQKTLLAVEGIASRFDKQEFANAARDGQQARHDKWVNQIAKETNVDLKD